MLLYPMRVFLQHNVHMGHYKWECDYRLSYFILGLRNGIHILNLFYTLFVLKQALYITYNMCMLGQKILISNNVGYKLEMKFKLEKINPSYLWYIDGKWTCGLLSNQKSIYLNNEALFLEFYGIGYNCLLPGYVFASNVKETTSCIFEAMVLDIPCSTLMDTDMGLYGIFYGIPSNDENFVSKYLFTRIFLKIYFKGVYDKLNSLKIPKDVKTYVELYGDNHWRKRFLTKPSRYWSGFRNPRHSYKFFDYKKLKRGDFIVGGRQWRIYPWSSVWIKIRKRIDNIEKRRQVKKELYLKLLNELKNNDINNTSLQYLKWQNKQKKNEKYIIPGQHKMVKQVGQPKIAK